MPTIFTPNVLASFLWLSVSRHIKEMSYREDSGIPAFHFLSFVTLYNIKASCATPHPSLNTLSICYYPFSKGTDVNCLRG